MFVATGTVKQLRRRHLSFAESKQENKVSKNQSYIILMITKYSTTLDMAYKIRNFLVAQEVFGGG